MARGSGEITAATSGAFVGLPYSFPTRIGNPEGRTSPEELLAAAHGGCFAMGLANELSNAEIPPDAARCPLHDRMDEVEGKGHMIVGSVDRRAGERRRDRRALARRRRRRRPTRAARSRCFCAPRAHSVEITTTTGGGCLMATDRTASVTWTGSLMDGSGTIDAVGSGAFGPLPVSWPSRAESPERADEPGGADRGGLGVVLLDGALAGLAKAGTPPEQLDTSVTVTFQPGEGIIKGAITVERVRPRNRRGGLHRSGRGREGELPRLEGARRDPRGHARPRPCR